MTPANPSIPPHTEPPTGVAHTPGVLTGGAAQAIGGATQAIEEVGELSARLTGNVLLSSLGYLGELFVLMGQTARALRQGVNPGDLLRQVAVIGVDSIPIALLTAGFSGAVLALYLVGTFRNYGATDLVGGVIALSIVRETGPILTGITLAARAGSAMTAEIGSMKVTEQIDALRSMAISPLEYLIVPRVVASMIVFPVVCVFADVAGTGGGAAVAANQGLTNGIYLNSIRQLMKPDGSDILKGMLKTVVFGILVAVIGCREGLRTEGGATGVGRSTTRSVVISIVLIFVADYILSFLLFKGSLF